MTPLIIVIGFNHKIMIVKISEIAVSKKKTLNDPHRKINYPHKTSTMIELYPQNLKI